MTNKKNNRRNKHCAWPHKRIINASYMYFFRIQKIILYFSLISALLSINKKKRSVMYKRWYAVLMGEYKMSSSQHKFRKWSTVSEYTEVTKSSDLVLASDNKDPLVGFEKLKLRSEVKCSGVKLNWKVTFEILRS